MGLGHSTFITPGQQAKQKNFTASGPTETEPDKPIAKTVKFSDQRDEEKGCPPPLLPKEERIYPSMPLTENSTYTLELKD